MEARESVIVIVIIVIIITITLIIVIIILLLLELFHLQVLEEIYSRIFHYCYYRLVLSFVPILFHVRLFPLAYFLWKKKKHTHTQKYSFPYRSINTQIV